MVKLRYAPKSRRLFLEARAEIAEHGAGLESAISRELRVDEIALLEYGLGDEHCPERRGLVFTLCVGASAYIFACDSAEQLARTFCGLQAITGRDVTLGAIARARLLDAIDRRCARERLGSRARHLAIAVRRANRRPRASQAADPPLGLAAPNTPAGGPAVTPPRTPISRGASPRSRAEVPRALMCLTP